MTEDALYNEWITGLIIAGVVVLVAATLLILILLAAKRIQKLADEALYQVIRIRENTRGIWELQKTNATVADISESTEQIKADAGRVAEALLETGKR